MNTRTWVLHLKTMTEEERKIFQGVLDSMYERFLICHCRKQKGVTQEKLKSLADGRIYTAQQALEYGLIDQIGYLDEAIDTGKTRGRTHEGTGHHISQTGRLQKQHLLTTQQFKF